MAKRKDETPKAPAMLAEDYDLETAKGDLQDRIQIGASLAAVKVTHGGEMEVAHRNIQSWDDYNVTLLQRMFTTDELATEYQWSGPSPTISFDLTGRGGPAYNYNDDLETLRGRLQYLESLIARIHLLAPRRRAALPVAAAASRPAASAEVPSRVFIVHGQDEAAKLAVARFLEKLDLQAIILHEQANRGDTVIEKLERVGDVDFAVVLLTGDDVGHRKGDPNAIKPRARQNVVLELGYFLARLGRKNVCALYQSGVELPSDYAGVVYLPLDDHGAWKTELAKELRAARFPIDMNKL